MSIASGTYSKESDGKSARAGSQIATKTGGKAEERDTRKKKGASEKRR